MQDSPLSRSATYSVKLVTVDMAARRTGLTGKAIRRKIETGKWAEGREYERSPDGGIYINLEAYEQWVVRGRGSRSVNTASESSSS